MARPKTTEHGYTMYRYHGCRCDICKASQAERNRFYRRKRPKTQRVYLDAQPLIDLLNRTGNLRNIHAATLNRWRDGKLDVFTADRWCIKLGYHPTAIFGAAFYADPEEADIDA